MESVLAMLTSQNIKTKVHEEEQRLKKVENGSSDHTSAQSVVVVQTMPNRDNLVLILRNRLG